MSTHLTVEEMASLRRALARRTGGNVRVGSVPITVAQGIALWNATASFEASDRTRVAGIGRLQRRLTRCDQDVRDAAGLHHVLKAGLGVAAIASLAGCTTLFGGNVKGSFACRAPEGICAPTSKIDDAALALISGDASLSPVGSYISQPAGRRQASEIAATAPVRSGERVLRIMFPAHIDGAGRFREASAIHAVVERGEWMAVAGAVRAPSALSVREAALSSAQASAEPLPAMPTLAELAASAPELHFPNVVADIDAQNALNMREAEEPVDTSPVAGKSVRSRGKQVGSALPADPVLPAVSLSSAAVSAALRSAVPARQTIPVAGIDPVAMIRAQVAARLAAGTSRTASTATSVTGGKAPAMTVSPVRYSLPSGSERASTVTGVGLSPGPDGAVKGSTGSSTTMTSAPVNGPTLFPVSEVHP